MKKILIFFIIIILFVNLAEAAKIHGAVYDTGLKKINGAVVEINTKPLQRFVAVNGEYSFNIPNGEYIIKAKYLAEDLADLETEEKITVNAEGDFVLDLFLLPDLEELNETEVDVESFDLDNGKDTGFIILIIILSIIGILVLLYILFPKKFRIKHIEDREEKIEGEKDEIVKEEKIEQKIDSEDENVKKIIDILKKEGGRMNQKDLRKMFAMSEAKMSLLIAELEHKGRIEKIKKGRGNIIILKK